MAITDKFILCISCKIEKPCIDFSDSNLKFHIRKCKACAIAYRKSHYSKNKDKVLDFKKSYYIHNKDKISLKKKSKYKSRSSEDVSRDKIRRRDYYINNKISIRDTQNKYEAKRRGKDPYFRLRKVISSNIRRSLLDAKDRSVLLCLDYTINELVRHIERQWDDWMSWENYGPTKHGVKTWQIDHIVPQSKLKYDSISHPNFKKCWALSNLRPLESFENLRKSNNG